MVKFNLSCLKLFLTSSNAISHVGGFSSEERGKEAEALPRRQVVAEHDLLQLGIAQGVGVAVPRQVAPQPPVCVLDRALLPRRVRVAEPGRHRAGAGEQACRAKAVPLSSAIEARTPLPSVPEH